MKKAGEILEAIYRVYNPQEEKEELETTGKQVYRGTYDKRGLINMFIGTILGNNEQDTMDNLRNYLDKMPEEWIGKFFEIVQGDVVEKVSESVNEEKQKTLHDKAFRPIYVGDYVAHIKGGYNSAVSIEIGKVIAIDVEKEKIQVDKNGSKSWVKPVLCVLTINREEVKLPEPTYADGRPVLNHNMYDLGLQDVWVK